MERVFDTWDAENHCLACGPGWWTPEDFEIWRWQATKGAPPRWPVPHPVKGWPDVWHDRPEDQQPVWLRRMDRLMAAVPALWDLSNGGFCVAKSHNPTPWQ